MINRTLALLQSAPWYLVILLGLALALAPFSPEPHLWQKIKLWHAGGLQRPIDVFDLLFHASGLVLIALKLASSAKNFARRSRND